MIDEKILVDLIAQLAIFFELADESVLPLEVAVKQQEEIAFRLQKLSHKDRQEFVRLLAQIAQDEPSPERRDVLDRLPYEIGLIEKED